jgi:hypothetical protein
MATSPASSPCAPPKRCAKRSEALSEADESRLGQYILAFKKIRFRGYENRARASLGELVHLTARSSGKHRLRDSLCRAIDSDDVLLSQLQNKYSFGIFQDDLKRLFMAELDALRDVPLFGPFSPEVMDYVKMLKEDTLFVSIQEKAPTLYNLNHLCENTSKRTLEKQNRPRVVSILSILAFSQHQRKCNTLPAILSLLLYSSGTKKRMFEITNALGWTESFGSVIQSVEGLKDQALDFMKEFIKKPWLVAYDNCDLKVGLSQQSDTKKSTLFSITSALLSPAVGLWRSLTQSDFKRTKL